MPQCYRMVILRHLKKGNIIGNFHDFTLFVVLSLFTGGSPIAAGQKYSAFSTVPDVSH